MASFSVKAVSELISSIETNVLQVLDTVSIIRGQLHMLQTLTKDSSDDGQQVTEGSFTQAHNSVPVLDQKTLKQRLTRGVSGSNINAKSSGNAVSECKVEYTAPQPNASNQGVCIHPENITASDALEVKDDSKQLGNALHVAQGTALTDEDIEIIGVRFGRQSTTSSSTSHCGVRNDASQSSSPSTVTDCEIKDEPGVVTAIEGNNLRNSPSTLSLDVASFNTAVDQQPNPTMETLQMCAVNAARQIHHVNASNQSKLQQETFLQALSLSAVDNALCNQQVPAQGTSTKSPKPVSEQVHMFTKEETANSSRQDHSNPNASRNAAVATFSCNRGLAKRGQTLLFLRPCSFSTDVLAKLISHRSKDTPIHGSFTQEGTFVKYDFEEKPGMVISRGTVQPGIWYICRLENVDLEICNKRFTLESDLHRHQHRVTHHLDIKVNNLTCRPCGTVFTDSASLLVHAFQTSCGKTSPLEDIAKSTQESNMKSKRKETNEDRGTKKPRLTPAERKRKAENEFAQEHLRAIGYYATSSIQHYSANDKLQFVSPKRTDAANKNKLPVDDNETVRPKRNSINNKQAKQDL